VKKKFETMKAEFEHRTKLWKDVLDDNVGKVKVNSPMAALPRESTRDGGGGSSSNIHLDSSSDNDSITNASAPAEPDANPEEKLQQQRDLAAEEVVRSLRAAGIEERFLPEFCEFFSQSLVSAELKAVKIGNEVNQG